MPTYDFLCEKCGYKIEQLVSMNYPKISQCPQCKNNSLIRCISSGAGIIFKGTGWWKSDKQMREAIKENEKMNKERDERIKEDPNF